MSALRTIAPSSLFLLLTLHTLSYAAPQKSAVAVCPLVDEEAGYLLGGSRNGQWLSAQAIAPHLKGGEKYRSYNWNARLSMARGSKPSSMGAPCPDTLNLSIKPQRGSFALGTTRNALLRLPHSIGLNSPVYQRQVFDLLKKQGISNPKVKIKRLWRVDLEGDGQEEVLIEAANHAGYDKDSSISPDSRAGEYSVVLMRKVIQGQVKTIVLEQEYYPKAKKFNAPNIFQLAGVLDVNGDGKMEVLVRARYYEGDSTSVYEVKGARVTPVLTAGCGA